MIATTDHSLSFEAAVIPVPVIENNTPDKTQFIVRRLIGEYYLDRLWIAGDTYGYQFKIPDDVQSRIQEQSEKKPVNVWLLYTAPEASENGNTRSGNPPATR